MEPVLDRVIAACAGLLFAAAGWLSRVVRALELGHARQEVRTDDLERRVDKLEDDDGDSP